MATIDLTKDSFEGIIDQGEFINDVDCKYPVYIPKLMGNKSEGFIPIWARNEVTPNKYSRWLNPKTEAIESAGSYMPLSFGMRVTVKFRNNSYSSAYICDIKSSVSKIVGRDDFYLINKTKGGSYIYQDDYRSVTGIIHNEGLTNITLDDSKIALSVCEPAGPAGMIVMNGFEVDKLGTKFRFKNSAIILDETGITFQVGKTSFVMTESGIQMKSLDKMDIITENRLNIKAQDLRMTGTEKVDVYTNEMRLTGAQMLNITGSVVSMDSTTSTHIKSSKHLVLESLMEAKLTSSNLEINALLNMNIQSLSTAVSGTSSLVLSGPNTVIDSISLSIDGNIMHNLGLATSTAKTIIATNVALALGMQAAGIAESSILGINTMVMGVVGSAMMETLTGQAKPVGNILHTLPADNRTASDTEQKNVYVIESDLSLHHKVKDQFSDLRNAHDIGIE